MKIRKINILFMTAIAFMIMGCGTKAPFQNVTEGVVASKQGAAGKPHSSAQSKTTSSDSSNKGSTKGTAASNQDTTRGQDASKPAETKTENEDSFSTRIRCKIIFSDNITCKKVGSNDVVFGGSTVKVGEKLIFTAKSEGIPTGWAAMPSAWAVWKSNPWASDDDKKYTLNARDGTSSANFTYTVADEDISNDKAGNKYIDITFLVKSQIPSVKISSLSDINAKGALGGIDVDNGIPHEIFYNNDHETAKKFKSFINAQRKNLEPTEYCLLKWVIGDEAIDADITSFKDSTDLKAIYYGQTSKTNNLLYEVHALEKDVKKMTDVYELELKNKKENNQNALVINANVVKSSSGVRYECNTNDPDGEIYLIQGSKIYLLPIDGLNEREMNMLQDKGTLLRVIKSIFAGPLNAVYKLRDNTDRISTIKKIKAVHDYLIRTVVYKTKTYSFSAYGALVKKEAVCMGYALAFKELLEELKVDCKYITGHTSTGGYHAWNIVNLGSKETPEYYEVDVTWDDAYSNTNGSYNDGYVSGELVKDRRYKYFLKSTQYMKKHDHSDSGKLAGYYCEKDTYDSVHAQNQWKWNELQFESR